MRQLFRPSALNATFQGTTLDEFCTVKLRVAAHPGQKTICYVFIRERLSGKIRPAFQMLSLKAVNTSQRMF